MNTRDQIISFLLQQDDQNKNTIAELQKQIAELQKQLAGLSATPEKTV
jgi:hypothetical protein